MDGVPNHVFFILSALLAITASALPEKSSAQINSNSVLVALLDSHYTELSELVEKALLLQTLEEAVSKHNITIFAPKNEALGRDLDPEFNRFLLKPGNLKSLQNLLLFHMIPARIESKHWPVEVKGRSVLHASLCRDANGENIQLNHKSGEKTVGIAKVVKSDDIVRPDGIIHGIERLLVPKSVQQDFNARRSLRATSAVLPEGAPEVDQRTHRPRAAGTSRFSSGSAHLRCPGSRSIPGSGTGSRSWRAAPPL